MVAVCRRLEAGFDDIWSSVMAAAYGTSDSEERKPGVRGRELGEPGRVRVEGKMRTWPSLFQFASSGS